MSGIATALISLALLWALAYVGAPLLVWTVAIGAGLVALGASGSLGAIGTSIAALLFVPLALYLNLPALRRKGTAGFFHWFKGQLPEMSSTEREALEAGDVWWEAEMFRGRPAWNKLLDFKKTELTDEEQAFLDGPTVELCKMLDEWKVVAEDRDLPPEVWQFIRDKGFFAMLIAKEHGGLGFSAMAQSAIVTRIATSSLTAAVTVMVPNSLGPGELLMHYGTLEQQKKWLPGLAKGKEIPCFGLTGVDVGSDASGLTDKAVVCRGKFKGKEVLGMKLTFSKRYITLAPVATVIGLAVKLYDPDGLLGDENKSDYGITCVLLPANTKGVKIGRRHYAGSAFTLESMRSLTASAVDNCAPSVVTAMAKYHMTEMMRTVINDAMDIHGGRGVMHGPRNYIQMSYAATPVAITVEGANILTRNLMIFGQGAVRCHPYVFPEMEAARENDLAEFDRLLFGHMGYTINRGVRAFTLGLTDARLARSPVKGHYARYFRDLERMSAGLAFVSDVTMLLLGGDLKRKERLSARLGDVMSQLYIASSVLKYALDNGDKTEDRPYADWALQHSLSQIQVAFDDFFANFPVAGVGRIMRAVVFPFGRSFKAPSDKLTSRVADHMMEPSELRNRLTSECFLGGGASTVITRMEQAYDKLIEVEPVYERFSKAAAKGEISGDSFEEFLADAKAKELISEAEAAALAEYEPLRIDAILTDDFTKEYIAGAGFGDEAQRDAA